MILTYRDGTRKEALLLSRTENSMRVVVPGVDDPIDLTAIHGVWVSDDCEPVHVKFAWQAKSHAEILTEADCICPHDLAARLIHLLRVGAGEDEPPASSSSRSVEAGDGPVVLYQ